MQAKVRRLATTFLLLSAILLATVAPVTGRAAQDPPADPTLFTPAPGGPAAPGGAPDDPTALRQRWVQVDEALLAGTRPGDRLGLNLFDDALYTGVVDNVTQNPSGSVSWAGYLEGEPFSQFVLVLGRGQVAGSITRLGAIYEVRHEAGRLYRIHEVDPGPVPLGPPILVEVGADAAPDSPAVPADDGSIIDVMVVYTPDARDGAGGTTAMLNLIDLAVAETNQSYANSGIAQRLRLANAAEIPYVESGYSNTDLDRLQNPSDGYLDEVHVLRDRFGADCVNLLVESMAYYAGRAYVMGTVSSDFAPLAFSVVRRIWAVGYFVFGHELGHNMGGQHDWYVNSSLRPYTYSHGYVSIPGGWLTVMSYYDECSDSLVQCSRIPYWSNPDISRGGLPTGVPAGTSTSCVAGDLNHPACDADNRLTLNNTAYTFANFRQRTQPPECHALSTTALPARGGSVELAPGPNCSGDFVEGTEVELAAVPAQGYTFTGWGGACSGEAPTCRVTLSQARSVAASFEETDYGRIIVDKVADPPASEQEFNFTVAGGPEDVYQDFALAGGDPPRVVSDLPPGLYSVEEEMPAGWEQLQASCDDGSSPGAVDLDPGETVTCTFYNHQSGTCSAPAAPVLLSPSNGSKTKESKPTFQWSEVPNADKYRLRLVEIASGTEVLSIATSGTRYTLERALEPADYYWRVRGLNDCGAGNWALRRSLTVLPTLPKAPELVAPADGSSVCTDTPLFDWHRIKGATGYRLQVDNDSRFATPAIDDGTSEGEYWPLQGLSPGSYYWRVRASNSAGEGDWSPVWRFRLGQCLYLPLAKRATP